MRLPLYHAMRLGDLPVASRVRSIWRLDALVPPEAFLQPLRTGWVGLECSPCIMYNSIMEMYTRQPTILIPWSEHLPAMGSFERSNASGPPCRVWPLVGFKNV